MEGELRVDPNSKVGSRRSLMYVHTPTRNRHCMRSIPRYALTQSLPPPHPPLRLKLLVVLCPRPPPPHAGGAHATTRRPRHIQSSARPCGGGAFSSFALGLLGPPLVCTGDETPPSCKVTAASLSLPSLSRLGLCRTLCSQHGCFFYPFPLGIWPNSYWPNSYNLGLLS